MDPDPSWRQTASPAIPFFSMNLKTQIRPRRNSFA